jgi:hypothetical protein
MDDYVRTFEDNGGVHINFRFKTEGGVDYFPGLSEPATSDSDELPRGRGRRTEAAGRTRKA